MNEELKKVIDEHDLWLWSDHEKGKRADLSMAYLSGADLRGADLSIAYLRGADLSDANLSMADLSDANLSDANLIGAYGKFSTFYGGKNHAWAAGGRIGVGCITMTIPEWIENYETIGGKNDYSSEEIARYGAWIKSCDWLIQDDGGEA